MEKVKRLLPIIVIAFIVVAVPAGLWLTRDKDPYVTKAAPLLPAPPLKELAERRGVQIGVPLS